MAAITWVTAFIDMTPAAFDDGASFWQAVTGSTCSDPRGPLGEFTTLLPSDGGGRFLRLQRTAEGPRVHVDLHTDDPIAFAEHAVAIGAEIVDGHGVEIMRSPAGFTFCSVGPNDGPAHRSAPFAMSGTVRADGSLEAPPALVDQVTFDVPAPLFSSEVEFWTQLTGWELRSNTVEPFAGLARAEGMPLRFLLQRLGEDDERHAATAHLDIACDCRQAEVAAVHESLGATVRQRHANWITMTDPNGLPYCLTARNPVTDAVAPRH